ncbi:MAG TPA: LacI family DNA-binding transcriptional regulator [Terrimesophilobacter sp.]|nr:LacI family DNA-binding transcriptional regulator [Terrimesophilobacter sp.]
MKRVTSRDVAEYVGCSVASVSLVVNGRHEGRISDQLHARILNAIEVLDYRPNQSARSLATRMPSNVVLVCPDVRNPFFGDVFHGLVESLAGKYGVDLRVGPGGADYDSDTVREAQAGNIAGLVLANPSHEVLATFQATCPTVLIDSPDATIPLDRVDIDIRGASRQIAEHLTSLGHRWIAYLDVRRSKDTFVQRRDGLEETLRAHGADIVATAFANELSVAEGAKVFRAAWPEWEAVGVTAVVCADDMLAFGVVGAAHSIGVSIPRRLSIASYNDIPFARLLDPPLTSVTFDGQELGRLAGLKLLDAINGDRSGDLTMQTRLEARASTAQAPPTPPA